MRAENWSINDEERFLILNGQTCCLCLEEADVQVCKLTSEEAENLAVLCEHCCKRLDGFPAKRLSVGPNGVRIAQRAYLAYQRRPSEIVASSREDRGLLDSTSLLWGDGLKAEDVGAAYAPWFAMTVCQVLGDPSNVPQAERLLGSLAQAFFWCKDPMIRLKTYEAIERIVDCLWRERFSPLVPAVARALGSLGAHLVRPDDVEEEKRDEPEDEWGPRQRGPWVKADAWLGLPLIRLEILGSRTLTVEGVDAVAAEVENIFARGLWCGANETVSMAAKNINSMFKKHRDGDEDRPRFPEGAARLRFAAEGLLELLHGQRSKDWKGPRRVLRAVL